MSVRLLLLILATLALPAAGDDSLIGCVLNHHRTLLGDWKATGWAVDSAGKAVNVVDIYTRAEKGPGEFTFSGQNTTTGRAWEFTFKVTEDGYEHQFPDFEVAECRGPLRGNGRLLVFRYSLPAGDEVEVRELAYSNTVHS